MAISLLYNPRGSRKLSIGSLTIPTTLSETHDFSSTVTDQPVETGARISDHIINDVETVTIEGFVSDTPLDGSIAFNSQSIFDSLVNLREARQLVTVVTTYKIYTDMAITRISVPRDQSTGQAMRFTIELKKVTRVGSLTIQLFEDVLSSLFGVVDQASNPLNLGRFVPSDITSTLNPINTLSQQTNALFNTTANQVLSTNTVANQALNTTAADVIEKVLL